MRYRLYVFDISYFSGKMEAYLRYKGIPFTRVEPSWGTIARTIRTETGHMKLPVLQTPDGAWLKDSTPMIEWLEARHPAPAVLPADPALRFLDALLEDYADEWLWRPALYYRWHFRLDAALYAARFAREFLYDLPLPRPLIALLAYERQRRVYLREDGIREETRAHVEGLYLRTLDALERIFAARPFLLGERPTLADFGFMGPLFRHFSIDPTPSRIMRERAPGVYEWVARLWNRRGDPLAHSGGAPGPAELPAHLDPLLADLCGAYLPYLHRNALACSQGQRRFDFAVQGVTYRGLPAVHYRGYCRQVLQRRLAELPPEARRRVEGWLAPHGGLAALRADGVLPCRYPPSGDPPPPLCRPRPVPKAEQWLRLFTGIGWHPPER